ncbi:galactose-1-phosphate uridylyltransferase [bacterium]|nr:MAG: galactose-1-phosphate uridylyltransferase [bacterium]RKZ26544.1 MAG: galactose-1-phosphate uridylyltransferase [bacterium]
MPELRKDPVIGRWVIIATERSKRPDDFLHVKIPEKPSPFCPFCEGNEEKTPPEVYAVRRDGTLPDTPGWKVRVVPNKFPALVREGEVRERMEDGYRLMDGVGAHEVIIETPKHDGIIPRLSEEEVGLILDAYRRRYISLKEDERLRYILIFKNHGREAGASLAHPHSQIIATPIVPKRVKEELYGSERFYREKGKCVYCWMIEQELSSKKRVVAETENFIAFCPFASRFPFEVWLLPKYHSAFFEDVKEPDEFASIFKRVITAIHDVLSDPPYNLVLHTSPTMNEHWEHMEKSYHWHMEIMPKLTRVAGFEWGTGFYINPTSPEEAARYLRERCM